MEIVVVVTPAMVLTDADWSDQRRECIEDCFDATQACEWCVDECCTEGDMADCTRLCRDAADMTTLCARLCARESGYAADIAETCAAVCEECADVCEQYDMEICQTCAEVCRRCADSCRSMA